MSSLHPLIQYVQMYVCTYILIKTNHLVTRPSLHKFCSEILSQEVFIIGRSSKWKALLTNLFALFYSHRRHFIHKFYITSMSKLIMSHYMIRESMNVSLLSQLVIHSPLARDVHSIGYLVFHYIRCCYHPTLLNTNFQFLDNQRQT